MSVAEAAVGRLATVALQAKTQVGKGASVATPLDKTIDYLFARVCHLMTYFILVYSGLICSCLQTPSMCEGTMKCRDDHDTVYQQLVCVLERSIRPYLDFVSSGGGASSSAVAVWHPRHGLRQVHASICAGRA